QKAPSVTVTWGWGSHDCLADLGNNAGKNRTVGYESADNKAAPDSVRRYKTATLKESGCGPPLLLLWQGSALSHTTPAN
ncbi:hypothetical protein ACK37B_18715, partial [Aeromonas veronii]